MLAYFWLYMTEKTGCNLLYRYLVASADLAEGAEIISESALVIGPAQDSQSVCLGCYSQLSDSLTFR